MTHSEAMAEYREASAAVRRAFGELHEARVDEIMAALRKSKAEENLTAAQSRLLAAEEALRGAEAVEPAPADIDASRPVPYLHADGDGVLRGTFVQIAG